MWYNVIEKGHRQMTKTEEETMTNQQRMDFEKKMREYEEYIRLTGQGFDWVATLIGVIMTVIAVGFSSLNIAYLIEMVVEHKFVTWKAAIHIFWAIVLLGQWVYHWAWTIMRKFK